MPDIHVEICLNAENEAAVHRAVTAAYDGGATTIELCSQMHLDGLTPADSLMAVARAAFRARPGLMVMIRPRAGDFVYASEELAQMHTQIEAAHQAAADGVVLGVLQHGTNRVDSATMAPLVQSAKDCGLKVTFHRAFDATPDVFAALEEAIDLGVDRILTCGIPWGRPGAALNGAPTLSRLIKQAAGRVEIVIGGGVNPTNVGQILRAVPLEVGPIGVHAYSGAMQNGQTTVEAVKTLIAAARAA
jgi:copper homeostasis protein